MCYDGTDITDLAMLIGLSHGDFLVVDGVTREESTSFLLMKKKKKKKKKKKESSS